MATKIKRLVVGTLAAVLLPEGAAKALAPQAAAYWVQHETGNQRPGANAEMHATGEDSRIPGHRDGRIGVHFYVDDREIIQMIPISEQGVHSGDLRG